MFPFLRRNTPADPDPPPALEVHQGRTDPIVQAVRGVGLPSDAVPHPGDVLGYVDARPTERFMATASSTAPTPNLPANPSMYLARAPPPQKQSSGWLSYVFGTAVPGLTAEGGTTDEDEPPKAHEGEKRGSFAIDEGLLPGSFPVPSTGKATLRTEATVREVDRRKAKDTEKNRKDDEHTGDVNSPAELVRGGGRIGTAPADPYSSTTPKPGSHQNPLTAPVRPSNLVLPSTYIKPSTSAAPPTSGYKPNAAVTKSPLNMSKPIAQPLPTTFASTLASPPVITGTPAYGLSSAKGKDGLTEAERVRKEWLDAQKEARRARRKEEKRAQRIGEAQVLAVQPGPGREDDAAVEENTAEDISRYPVHVTPSIPRDTPSAPVPEEQPLRKKKKKRRDDGNTGSQMPDAEAETGIQRIIIPQPMIVPATHAKRFVEQQGQQPERRPRRSKQTRRVQEQQQQGQPAGSSIRPDEDNAHQNLPTSGTRSGATTVHRHHSHLRARDTRTTSLLRQASMRRRNVWDDLGDLSAGERAPPPAFEATGARGLPGASPLAREAESESEEGNGGDASAAGAPRISNDTGVAAVMNGQNAVVHPDLDPNDPPPPFPESEGPSEQVGNAGEALVPPRSPPPSFEFAIAQVQVRRTSPERRTSTSSSTSSGSSLVEYGPPTEMQSRMIDERQAWERDITLGFSLEERLERAAQRAKLLEQDGGPASGLASIPEPVSEASAVSMKPETSMEVEPVSRFSKEEKGKGKAVEEHGSAMLGAEASDDIERSKPVQEPLALNSVNLAPVADAKPAAAMRTDSQGVPSRSYIRRSSTGHSEPTDARPSEPISPVGNDLGRSESKPDTPDTSTPKPLITASPISLAERPLPALPQASQPSRSPQPLFSRKSSGGRESNPWKLLRKMSSAGATAPPPEQISSSPLQSPSGLIQRRPSELSGTDQLSLSRSRSKADERPKPAKRPSTLSKMTSQLFKPNLGMETGNSQAESASEDRQNGQEINNSPKIENSAKLESTSEKLTGSPVPEPSIVRHTDQPSSPPLHQGPPKPYIASKHPFNRAMKPAWMQTSQPIWQDSRAVILGAQDESKMAEISERTPHEPLSVSPAKAPAANEGLNVSNAHKEGIVGQEKPRVMGRLPPPPPVPIRNPLPAKQPIEALPPPKLALRTDEEVETVDSTSTASDLSDSDSDSASEDASSLSSSSSSTSLSEVMAKRRVSTYRLLPPRGIPAEVLRSSEPPPPNRWRERREQSRPNGPRTRNEAPPLPPRPSAPTIVEEPTQEEVETRDVEPAVARPVQVVPAELPTKVTPPSFPSQPVPRSPPLVSPRRLPDTKTAVVESVPAIAQTAKPAPPPVPPRKPQVRKPSNGNSSVQPAVEPVKEATLQERIMASLLPEAPSHERPIPRALQDSIRTSLVPAGTMEAPVKRTRPAPYRSLMSGAATPQTAPLFQTAQPKRKKAANPTGKLNIKPRLDDRPELELKSQLALRVNRWRMKEVPWTREEIEEELRRMNTQVEDDHIPPQKVERTHSSPEVATKGIDPVRVGSGRIRDGQMRMTSSSTADSKEKRATKQAATQPLQSPVSPSAAQMQQTVTASGSPGLPASPAVNDRASLQQSTAEPSQPPLPTHATRQISPTIEYTDLDLAAARLEGTTDEFEGIREITSFVSETARRGATPTELSNLFIAPVEVESRRTTKEGKTKLKLSALGVRVLKCSICLNNFRSGEVMAMMPKCGHVGHQRCVVNWLKRDARCMVCRESL